MCNVKILFGLSVIPQLVLLLQSGGNLVIDYLNMNIEESFSQGGLGRHETFAPRYGWLKKGFDAATKNPSVFKGEDAIIELGVGKNMIRSIRSWCLALKILSIEDGEIVATELGRQLLSNDDGWDPYIEDDASLWLLHWQLFVPPFEAVSWPLAFNYCNLRSFDLRELSRTIYNAGRKYPKLDRISPQTYQRDASCIIRMYLSPEEKDYEIESQFCQLGLMYSSIERNQVSFNTGPKLTLPAAIFAAACFSYIMFYVPEGQKAISLQRLVFGTNSPGVAFKLPETEAGRYLSEASEEIGGFSLVESMGNVQVHLSEEPKHLYVKALDKFYSER